MEYVAPKYGETAFNCPHCGAYSHQEWKYRIDAYNGESGGNHMRTKRLALAYCARCRQHSIWASEKIVFPREAPAPRPSPDMPQNVLQDYDEARGILQESPRAAAALLRLAIQRLCKHLGESGDNLNCDIGNLVKRGLPASVQQALDVVRVVGNNAVHPGQIDVNDKPEIALSLFKLVNMIVDVMISQPQGVQELFESLPEGAKKQITERDGAS